MLLEERPAHQDVSGASLFRKATPQQLFQTLEYLATQFALPTYQLSFALINFRFN